MRCPDVVIEMETIDLAALNQRAAGATPAAAPATPLPLAAPADNSPTSLAVRRLNDWVAAWEAKDVNRYMSFYAPGFRSGPGNTDAWKAKRRVLVGKPGTIGLKIEEIQTRTLAADRVETSFKQTYRSADYSDVISKTLTWQQINGQWLIVKESNR